MAEMDNKQMDKRSSLANSEEGAIGYMVAWLMGIPASVLFVIFLLRGCN
jgi:hypothetical protein